MLYKYRKALCCMFLLMWGVGCKSSMETLPIGFVYLKHVDPTIIQSVRYYTSDNFIGRRVNGYRSGEAIIAEEAAQALKKANARLHKDGYVLVVYDAYRPQRAVNEFVDWANSPDASESMKQMYFPRIERGKLFESGYLSARSKHSLGTAVDVTIIKRGKRLHAIKPVARELLDGSKIFYLDDGTVDMGSSFDLLDVASHTDVTGVISAKHQENRDYLRKVMEEAGFEGYSKEWWHFSLRSDPFKNHQPFDF